MPSPKKEITEDTAAVTYINTIAERIKRDWDKIHESVKEVAENKNIISDEKQAIDEFMGANIAIGIQAINNIFTTEQAERLNRWITYYLDDENLTEIMKYNEIYEKAIEESDEPVGTVAGVLIFNWLGRDRIKLEKLGIRLQFLCMGIGEEFLINGKYWKTIKEKFKLTASDLPKRRQRNEN